MSWPSRYNFVAAIEGVDTLLTNGSTADAVTAWSGTDWTSATGGLFVDLDQQQSAHPWEPFGEGGTLTLTIADESIGVLTHRTAGGAESELVTGIDRNDTTVTVKDTSAFPASGTVHIGSEAVAYASKNATSFLSCTRGMFSPFESGLGTRYAHNHRVDAVDYAPPLAPKVTQYQREWVGRWVGLWRHGFSGGTMQTKGEATCVFAGRIVEVRDDPATLSTVIVIEHVLSALKDATVGRDSFSGEVADGVYIPENVSFQMRDFDGSTWLTADALTVVASGAAGANQMNAGHYTSAALFTALNAWWVSELTASRLHGSYSIAQATTNNTPDSIRTKITWSIAVAAPLVKFQFTMPKVISIFLGFNGNPTDALGTDTVGDEQDGNDLHHFYKDHIPLRTWVSTGISDLRVQLESLSGAFQDQYDTMPADMKLPPALAAGRDFGLFLWDDRILVRAAVVDNLDGTYELQDVTPSSVWFGSNGQDLEALSVYAKRIDDDTPTRVRQVFMFAMPAGDFVNRLMYAGGTTGFNHATHDDLPFGCAVGYPGELLGSAWETSVANMPGADKPIAVVIDKPTKVSALIGSDLVLRHVFPVWKSGGLRMATWQTPTNSLAVATFTEDNKAEPSGNDVEHRAATLLSDRWAKPLIKVRYNRDITRENGGGGEYKGTINIEDRTAIDDAGDRGEPFTIDARNSYSEFVGTGAGVEDLVHNAFIPPLTMFTKPMRTLRRSIWADHYEDLAPGDIVQVSDNYARDPSTGLRLISNRPAIIVSHRYNPGGSRPDGTVDAMVGEVTLALVDTNRVYAYSPSALVSSYTSGTLTLACAEHEYSEASEAVDASRFGAGDAVRIVEVDPTNPASPLTWTRGIVSRSGNNLVHDGVALAGYDAAKTYRIIPDTYSACQAPQQDKAFQADDTDGLIEDEAQANMFGLVVSTINTTASSHTQLPERHADVTAGDGKPYDVGSLIGLARTVENLIDHKTAISSPMLGPVVGNTTYSSGQGWRLVLMTPVYLSTGILSNSVVRYAKVAPIFHSTDGTSTQIRVTLCTHPPNDATLNDIVRPTPNTDATWQTSSTTYQTGSAATLTLNVKGAGGIAWLLVECNYKCETYGLGQFTEQERTVF